MEHIYYRNTCFTNLDREQGECMKDERDERWVTEAWKANGIQHTTQNALHVLSQRVRRAASN